MQWQKISQIINPKQYKKLGDYASHPFALHIQHDLFRLFFNGRTQDNRSFVTYCDIDLTHPRAPLDDHWPVVLSPGGDGLFDDSGVSLGWIDAPHKTERILYYVGWNLSQRVPWRNSIGSAQFNTDTKQFEKLSLAPLLDRSEVDPFSLSYPCVLKDGQHYHMWYGSNLSWGSDKDSMNHAIKYAHSKDGIHWNRTGQICIQSENESEFAFSKPSVLLYQGRFFMWYSYRGDAYRIGFATSEDGIQWQRRDHEVGIDIDKNLSWQNYEISYSHVFTHSNDLYMLYTGNHYGKGGLGLAKTSLTDLNSYLND